MAMNCSSHAIVQIMLSVNDRRADYNYDFHQMVKDGCNITLKLEN